MPRTDPMHDITEPRVAEVLAEAEQDAKTEESLRLEEEISLRQAVNETPALKSFGLLPDSYLDSYKLKRCEVVKLVNQLATRIVRPSSAVPMICTGPVCQIKHVCTLRETRDHDTVIQFPIGYPCPIETSLIDFWRQDYYRTLKIDVQDKIERDRIEELLEIDLTLWRISSIIASKGYTVENMVGAVQGIPLMKTELNPLLEAKDKAAKRKDRILDELIATRESKEKSALRRAKGQLLERSVGWYKSIESRAKELGVTGVESPIELAIEKAKQEEIEFKPDALS
jgi:hypothetical protein